MQSPLVVKKEPYYDADGGDDDDDDDDDDGDWEEEHVSGMLLATTGSSTVGRFSANLAKDLGEIRMKMLNQFYVFSTYSLVQ